MKVYQLRFLSRSNRSLLQFEQKGILGKDIGVNSIDERAGELSLEKSSDQGTSRHKSNHRG